MRLATVRTEGETRAARQDGDEFVLLEDFADVGELLAREDWLRLAAAGGGDRVAFSDADLAPVVPRPPKIVCLGMNYRSHIGGRPAPERPEIFFKPVSCLQNPGDPILYPHDATDLHYEGELVIGRTVRRATGAQARDAIAGFTVLNDVSMRDWQFRTMQFLQGKTWDRSTPVGPVLVTPDELPGGTAPDLALRCEVDGEVMQEGRTSDLLFGPEELVAYISTIVTLDPTDLIATGTPSGVGFGRSPQVFLKPGHVVRTTIEHIGELVNRCTPAP